MPRQTLNTEYSVEEYLTGHTPPVRELAERLRRLVRRTVLEATETAYPRWHGIGYRHPDSGYFCAIFPQDDRVLLSFEFGVLLLDPAGLLEGDGKQIRYVPIRKESDIREDEFVMMIHAALDLPSRRDDKLEMIRAGVRVG